MAMIYLILKAKKRSRPSNQGRDGPLKDLDLPVDFTDKDSPIELAGTNSDSLVELQGMVSFVELEAKHKLLELQGTDVLCELQGDESPAELHGFSYEKKGVSQELEDEREHDKKGPRVVWHEIRGSP